jgi:L-asparaginase/Glu-tRNA(Gln) amidotransferase subunit D
MADEIDKIVIYETGGTISARFDWTQDGVCYDGACQMKGSPVDEYLQNFKMGDSEVKNPFGYEVRPLFYKNSTEWLDTDRDKVVDIIKKEENKRIVLTQGTGTIGENAEHFKKELLETLLEKNQTMIMTGSTTPIIGVTPSDGPHVLSLAIVGSQLLPSGLFVAGHHGYITSENVDLSGYGHIISKNGEYVGNIFKN